MNLADLANEGHADGSDLAKLHTAEMDAAKEIYDVDIDYDQIDNCCFLQTFKIYSNTTFEDVKMAACKFWRLKDQESKYILTDERFNNLATYRDTVMNFFAQYNGYEPMNQDEHMN